MENVVLGLLETLLVVGEVGDLGVQDANLGIDVLEHVVLVGVTVLERYSWEGHLVGGSCRREASKVDFASW